LPVVEQFAHSRHAQIARRVNLPHASGIAGDPKSASHFPASRLDQEGRFAVVTNVDAGCDGRFGGALTSAAQSGRQSRVVLTPRRWRQACGVIREATVAKQPGHRGERGISRKPLRREGRVNPVNLW